MLEETTQQPKEHFPQILILDLHFSYTAKAMLCLLSSDAGHTLALLGYLWLGQALP